MIRFSKPLKILAIIAMMAVLTNAGCILNPETGGDEEPIDVDWPDLDQPEEVIETIKLIYENFNRVPKDKLRERYEAVLHDDPSDVNDYIWNMRPDDVTAEVPEVMYRSEDIEGTMYIIDNASSLTLEIYVAGWDTATDVCEECLITTREYRIDTTLNHKGEIMDLSGTNFRVQFIVGPNLADPGKWAIYIASDMDPSQ